MFTLTVNMLSIIPTLSFCVLNVQSLRKDVSNLNEVITERKLDILVVTLAITIKSASYILTGVHILFVSNPDLKNLEVEFQHYKNLPVCKNNQIS